MMRTIAIPFLGRAVPEDRVRPAKKRAALLPALFAALDRLVPPPAPGCETDLPPEFYKFSAF